MPKIQVTPSASPSGWQDPQLLQASFDCLPLKFRGTICGFSAEDVVVRDTEGGEEGHLAEQLGMLYVPGAGGSLEAMSSSSVRRKPSSMFMDVTEKLASLLA